MAQKSENATAGLESLDERLEIMVIPEDRPTLERFVSTATRMASMGKVSDVISIAQEAHIDLEEINRDSALNIALWVAWLQVAAQNFPKSELRYQSVEDFLNVYSMFLDYDAEEVQRLMHTANWMYFLFQKIPAKKNKGLAIQVVPKLVEGLQARYVTGSGQTRSTADRVRIYEVEGGIQPYQRVKMNKRKRQPHPKKDGAKRPAVSLDSSSKKPRVEGKAFDNAAATVTHADESEAFNDTSSESALELEEPAPTLEDFTIAPYAPRCPPQDPFATYLPCLPSPRLVRLCSWGTTHPDPQVGDHNTNPCELPAFPQVGGQPATSGLFPSELNDGVDPFDLLLLRSNFDFDEPL